MLIHVKMPNEKFNLYVKDGTVSEKIKRILDESKPEAVYFTEYHGMRGVILLADVAEPSRVPHLVEPWFLVFDAHVEIHVVMDPAELEKAGLEKLAKKWV